MKKTLLLIALLFISTVGFSQNVLGLFNKANSFFTYMAEAKYDTAHAFFDESEQVKITPDNLKKLWDNINANLGKAEVLDAVSSKVQGEFFAVTVEGKFEKAEQNFVLMFNKKEKIVGLFMPPKAAAYIKPAYADTTLYTEKPVYLQSLDHQLAAIITTPKNKTNFPVVVFVHGSGPGDMDETVGPNKPFKDLATGLAAKGIASIRYVKRTLIYQSEFNKAFTVKEEVTDDALAAIALAKTVAGADQKSIYVFGHSLGGMLAPKLATLSPTLKGIILAAAPARKLADIIIDQNKYIIELSKDTTKATQTDLAAAIKEIEKSKLVKLAPNMKPDSVIIGLPASYWTDLNSYDQVATAKKLKQRILVFQGGNDFQVSMTDYNIWNAALGKSSKASVKLYPELNHLLSPQTEKAYTQQYQIPVNVSEKLIGDIALWINDK